MAEAVLASDAAEVAAILGGAKALRRRIRDADAMQQALRQGLPYAAFDAVRAALDVPAKTLAAILGVASRTLARRRAESRLSPLESDRLYRVAHVASTAAGALGSIEAARAWLTRPNTALGGEAPIALLDTEIGERRVEDVLLRLRHGIYA